MILGKKKVLASLFKKDEKQRKTFEFLNQNFNEVRWKNAANKNAYALLIKKNYEASAGFFILGGFLAVILILSFNLTVFFIYPLKINYNHNLKMHF